MSTAQQTPIQLIDEGQRLVHSLAARIHRGLNPRIELDDLIGYGQVGLAEAARDFDESQGCQFITFAFYRVRGAIYDGLSKMSWSSRAHHKRMRYEQMANLALSEAGDAPAAASLLEDARWLRGATEKLSVIFFALFDGLSGAESQVVDSHLPPAATAADREIQEKVRLLVEALPDEERTLIQATYFEGQTLKEAADRLEISKSWASRLHAKALDSLARSLRRMGME